MSGMKVGRCPVCGEPARSNQPKHTDGMCDDCLFTIRASIRGAIVKAKEVT